MWSRVRPSHGAFNERLRELIGLEPIQCMVRVAWDGVEDSNSPLETVQADPVAYGPFVPRRHGINTCMPVRPDILLGSDWYMFVEGCNDCGIGT